MELDLAVSGRKLHLLTSCWDGATGIDLHRIEFNGAASGHNFYLFELDGAASGS